MNRRGYPGGGSFFSGYPEAREVFLEQAWKLDDDGPFVEPVNGTAGVWVRCDDVQLVQFLAGEDEDDGDNLEAEPERTEEGDYDAG